MSFINVRQLCIYLPFGFEGLIWDLTVLVPDHQLIPIFKRCLNIGHTLFKFVIVLGLTAFETVILSRFKDRGRRKRDIGERKTSKQVLSPHTASTEGPALLR